MVKVKICGLTRLEDAVVALEAGADFLGFILFPPSPRAISEEAVARLSGELRTRLRPQFARPNPPLLIGVFVNRPAAEAAHILSECGLDLAQLSGDEDAQQLIDSSSPLFKRAYKAIRPRSIDEAKSLTTRYTNFESDMDSQQPRLLIDSPHAKLYGGTGKTGDWSLAARLAAITPGLMLAGGLDPDNVAQAVTAAKPYAVDVAGGVEDQPGIKNHVRLREFIRNAKSVKTHVD